MLQRIRADLHVHTCLSPCGELEMSPRKIVAKCMEEGLNAIAVCDHNTAENVIAVIRAARGQDLTVMPGMEIATSEEVHILGLFDEIEQALTLQGKVYGHMLPGKNDEDLFGIQVVSNEFDEVEEIVDRFLIGGTTLPIETVVETIHDLGGLAIASHIDREVNSLLGQLGFIPENLAVDALEVSALGNAESIKQIPGVDRYPIVRSSDAHRLSEIGRATTVFEVERLTIAEMRLAFMQMEGRSMRNGVQDA